MATALGSADGKDFHQLKKVLLDSTGLEEKETLGQSFRYLRGYELSGEQSVFTPPT